MNIQLISRLGVAAALLATLPAAAGAQTFGAKSDTATSDIQYVVKPAGAAKDPRRPRTALRSRGSTRRRACRASAPRRWRSSTCVRPTGAA